MPKSRVNVIIISAVITEVHRNISSAIYILSVCISKVNAKRLCSEAKCSE